jgi:hypothetical protein
MGCTLSTNRIVNVAYRFLKKQIHEIMNIEKKQGEDGNCEMD